MRDGSSACRRVIPIKCRMFMQQLLCTLQGRVLELVGIYVALSLSSLYCLGEEVLPGFPFLSLPSASDFFPTVINIQRKLSRQ